MSTRTLREELRGISRLIVDATIGATHLVEDLHRNLQPRCRVSTRVARSLDRGIAGLVYDTIRSVTRSVGAAVDLGLVAMPMLDRIRGTSRGYDTWLATLNGVVGDRLAASGSPLAMQMQLRHNGVTLAPHRASIAATIVAANRKPARKVLVLVHGLCRSDTHWNRNGHDHGERLSAALGYTPIYLRYNSGLHISQNGRLAADLLESLLAEWPVAVEEVAVVAHSMGGLVARSACDAAQTLDHQWLQRLRKLVFLGVPHHGAPLERGGHWLHSTIGRHPYTAALAKLGELRSAGITDLRHAALRDEDWVERNRFEHTLHPVRPMPLPQQVDCFAVAGALRIPRRHIVTELVGDGLVPVRSAFGDHEHAAFALGIPESRRRVVHGVSHIALLGHEEVCSQLVEWLAPPRRGRRPSDRRRITAQR